MTPSVDIVIVNHNTATELIECLASLHAAWPACARTIVVVDNASTDGSADAVRSRYPGVAIKRLSTNIGFGAANNVALRESGAPFVLLLNSDTLVPAGAVDGLLDRLVAREAAFAGPRLVDATGRPEVSFGSMLSPWTEAVQRIRVRLVARPSVFGDAYIKRFVGQERFVDWVSGACLLVDRQKAAEAGYFDERYFMYEEDVDLCAAIRRRGGRVLYTPAVEVVHLRGRSVSRTETTATPSHYDRSHVAFYEKHAPGWAPWLRAWLRLRGRPIR